MLFTPPPPPPRGVRPTPPRPKLLPGPLCSTGCVLAALAFSGAFLLAANPARASDLADKIAGKLTAQEQAEVDAWGDSYWKRVEGQPSPWVGFSPALDNPLFNPLRSKRASLENLKVISASDCDVALANDTLSTDAETISKRSAVKDAMVHGKLATNPVANPDGTIEHIVKILDASMLDEAEFVAYSEGGNIVSLNLPLDAITAWDAGPLTVQEVSNDVPIYYGSGGTLSDTTSGVPIDVLGAFNAIVVAAPGYVATATGKTEAAKLALGVPSKADQLLGRIEQLLTDLGRTDCIATRLQANFGVYGDLPLVKVQYGKVYILIDGTNGNVSAPMTGAINARSLLSQHIGTDAATVGIRYFSPGGCPAVAAGWNPGPPPGGPWIPRPAVPGFPPISIPVPGGIPAPGFPGFITPSPGIPGWHSIWTCITTPAECGCISYHYETGPGGIGIVLVRSWCKDRGVPCAGPTAPAGSTPIPLPKCTDMYWY